MAQLLNRLPRNQLCCYTGRLGWNWSIVLSCYVFGAELVDMLKQLPCTLTFAHHQSNSQKPESNKMTLEERRTPPFPFICPFLRSLPNRHYLECSLEFVGQQV